MKAGLATNKLVKSSCRSPEYMVGGNQLLCRVKAYTSLETLHTRVRGRCVMASHNEALPMQTIDRL